MSEKKGRKSSRILENMALIIVIVMLWWFVTESEMINSVLLPSPKTILNTLWRKIADGSLAIDIAISIRRVLKGYLCAVIIGVALGCLVGMSKHAYVLTKVVIQILKPIPPIAWIPLVILWFGIGESSKVFLIFLGGFFVVLTNVVDGIRNVDSSLIEVARAAETPVYKYIFCFIIPAALPGMFTGFKVALGTCWSCVIAAELVAASSGIGYMISNARNFGQMDVVIIGMFSIGIVGKIMDEILRIAERKILRWNR